MGHTGNLGTFTRLHPRTGVVGGLLGGAQGLLLAQGCIPGQGEPLLQEAETEQWAQQQGARVSGRAGGCWRPRSFGGDPRPQASQARAPSRPNPSPPRVSEFQGPGQADFCHHGDQFFLRISNTYDLLSLSGLQALAPQADRRTQMAGLSHPQRLVGQLTVHLHSTNIC